MSKCKCQNCELEYTGGFFRWLIGLTHHSSKNLCYYCQQARTMVSIEESEHSLENIHKRDVREKEMIERRLDDFRKKA